MSLVKALRELWRFRLLVGLVALFAATVGTAMMFKVTLPFDLQSRQHQIGIASAQALIDTPSSQVVDLGGKTGADIRTLAARANLLASLMTSSPIKDEIARRAHVPADLLVTPSSAQPGPGATGATDVSGTVSAEDPRAYVLRTSVPTLESGEVPIIAVDTRAPDAERAQVLADQAIAVLRAHLEDIAGNEAVPARRRVTIRELGPARSTVRIEGPSRLMAFVVMLFIFGAGCGAILGIAHLARGLQLAMASGPDLEPEPVEPMPEPLVIARSERAAEGR